MFLGKIPESKKHCKINAFSGLFPNPKKRFWEEKSRFWERFGESVKYITKVGSNDAKEKLQRAMRKKDAKQVQGGVSNL